MSAIPDHGPRLIITSDNQAALIVIITAIGLAWTLMVFTIRLVTKLHVKASLGLEELGMGIASVAALGSSIAILVGVKYGLGQKGHLLTPDQVEQASKALYSSEIIYIFALGASKCGTLPLLNRLTPIKYYKVACYIVASLTICWIIASEAVIGTRCDIQYPWRDISSARCEDLFTKWAVIESIGLIIEALIFLVAVSIIYILKMKWQAKLKVIFAFATRLPIIIPTVFRLIYLRNNLNSTDSTYYLSNAIIATQVNLHYTVMAASFAYLKPFLSAFDSNLGATVKVNTVVSNTYGRGYQKSGGSSNTGTGQEQSNAQSRNQSRVSSSYGSKSISPFKDKRFIQGGDFTRQARNTLSWAEYGLDPGIRDEQVGTLRGFDFELNRRSQPDQIDAIHLHTHADDERHTNSSDSKLPIITKTQEWHVHIEDRDARQE